MHWCGVQAARVWRVWCLERLKCILGGLVWVTLRRC
uniref:Uncharacterized protein n=1 Tax=Anguilla anguilla TaxID=7936 RepID=A0A0E9SNK4_ANGAN